MNSTLPPRIGSSIRLPGSSPLSGVQAETRRTLQLLTGEVQKSFYQLNVLVEALQSARDNPDEWAPLQESLRKQLAHLSEGISLVGTILETESNEILRYVEKHRP